MGFFDNAVNDAVPQGNLTKPLIIAAGALILARMLRGSGSATDDSATTQASIPAPVPAPAPAPEPSAPQADDQGGLLGGLGDLLEKFQQAGHGNVANSWIGSGPNQPIQPGTLGQVLGSQTVQDLAQKAGINPNDLLGQLAQHLPEIINKLTPNGRLPTQSDLGQ